MAFGLGMPELVVIGLVFVLLFGGKKLGEIGTGLGKSITEFKKASKDLKEAEKELKRDL